MLRACISTYMEGEVFGALIGGLEGLGVRCYSVCVGRLLVGVLAGVVGGGGEV
jgi:hypothetical protein